MKQGELVIDGKEIGFGSLQKTIEATLDQKVVEEDREEAMELVLQSLILLQRNHHPNHD